MRRREVEGAGRMDASYPSKMVSGYCHVLCRLYLDYPEFRHMGIPGYKGVCEMYSLF